MKSGLVFGSVTSDMPPALIERYDLLRGVKKLGTWWEWSELFFGNGFDLSMNRRDTTDALWAATLAANKGPGQWYTDSESLRYSFFDKVVDEDESVVFGLAVNLRRHIFILPSIARRSA